MAGVFRRRPDADLILYYVTIGYVMLFHTSEIQLPAQNQD